MKHYFYTICTTFCLLLIGLVGYSQSSVINKDGKVVSVSTGTPFNLTGTTTDANDNKSTAIERTGSVLVTNGFFQARGTDHSFTMDPTDGTGPRIKLGTIATPNSFFEIGAWNAINNFDSKARDLNFMSTSAANILYLRQATGYVGINTNNPLGRFVVDDRSYISTLPTTTANLMDNSTFRPLVRFQNTSGVNNNALSLFSTTSAFSLQSHNYSLGTSLPLLLQTAGGNVGIGTTNPTNRLFVLGDARFQFNTNNLGVAGDNVWAEFYGKVPTGTDTQVGGLKLGWYNTFGGIEVIRPGGAVGLGLGFNYANPTTGATTEGMRLTNIGYLGIGTTSPISQFSNTGSLITGVSSNNAIAGGLAWATSGNGFSGAFFNSSTTGNGLLVKINGNASTQTAFEVNSGLQGTVTNTHFRILGDGKIGVGTSGPTQRFVVLGTNNQPSPANSGVITNATFRVDGNTNHALDVGTYTNSPFGAYLQVIDKVNPTNNLPLTLNPTGGNIGIGIDNPTSRLEVNGAATNTTAFNAGAGTSIDFSRSNLAYTTASAGAFTLTNMKDGGTYTLAVQGTTSGTASFTASGFTVRNVNNGATTAGRQTLYTFIVMGTTIYVYMTTGFN